MNYLTLDRTSDLRQFLGGNQNQEESIPSRLDEHTDILNELWPQGDKSLIYKKLIPCIPGQTTSMYRITKRD